MNRFSGAIVAIGLTAVLPLGMPAQAAAPAAAADKAAALDPASLALAHDILTIAFPPEKRADMMGSVMDSIIEQTRKNVPSSAFSNDKDFQAVLDRSLKRMEDQMKASVKEGVPDYFESFARAYARDFSREDLEAIDVFVKTPAGQHYFARSAELMKDPDVQAAGARMSKKLLARLPEIQRETLRDVQDYIDRKQHEKAPAKASVS